MQSEQGVFTQIVIELEFAPPVLLTVAFLAGFAELAAVRILGAMAIHAALAQLLRRCHGSVAGMAIELGVRALQVANRGGAA